MKPEVIEGILDVAEVRLDEVSAYASARPVMLRVRTKRGVVQHHRGFVGLVTVEDTEHVCEHQLHLKEPTAKKCAITLAKRLVREGAES